MRGDNNYLYADPSNLILEQAGFESGSTGGYNLLRDLGYGASLFVHVDVDAEIIVISEQYSRFMPFYDENSDDLCDEGAVRELVTTNYDEVMTDLCEQGIFEKTIQPETAFVKTIAN